MLENYEEIFRGEAGVGGIKSNSRIPFKYKTCALIKITNNNLCNRLRAKKLKPNKQIALKNVKLWD